MNRLTTLGLLSLAILATPAGGVEIEPEFLSGGKVYSTDPDSCNQSQVGPDDSSVVFFLDRRGVSGYEFGCNFLSFLDARFDAEDVSGSVLAIAVCGDDSGITRGNTFHMAEYSPGILNVTSQNDYLLSFLPAYHDAVTSEEDTSEDWYLIEREFHLCPQN